MFLPDGKFRHGGMTTFVGVLSSQRTVVALGAVVLAGSILAYALYWQAFLSVWCFFAAAASIVILCHLEWSRDPAMPGGSLPNSPPPRPA